MDLLAVGSQSRIGLGDPLGAVAFKVCAHSIDSLCCLCLVNRAANSTLYNAGCALECVQLSLGIIHAVAEGLLDTKQLIEILFNILVVIDTADFNAGCVHTCGITEHEYTIVLLDFLTFGVLGSFTFILVTDQIGHTVHASQGGLAEEHELVAFLDKCHQAGRGRYIAGHILQTVDLTQLLLLGFGFLQRNKNDYPDLGAHFDPLDVGGDRT